MEGRNPFDMSMHPLAMHSWRLSRPAPFEPLSRPSSRATREPPPRASRIPSYTSTLSWSWSRETPPAPLSDRRKNLYRNPFPGGRGGGLRRQSACGEHAACGRRPELYTHCVCVHAAARVASHAGIPRGVCAQCIQLTALSTMRRVVFTCNTAVSAETPEKGGGTALVAVGALEEATVSASGCAGGCLDLQSTHGHTAGGVSDTTGCVCGVTEGVFCV